MIKFNMWNKIRGIFIKPKPISWEEFQADMNKPLDPKVIEAFWQIVSSAEVNDYKLPEGWILASSTGKVIPTNKPEEQLVYSDFLEMANKYYDLIHKNYDSVGDLAELLNKVYNKGKEEKRSQ